MNCMDYECPYRTLYGYCSITACVKPIKTNTVVLNNVDDKQVLIFPHTIGDITFYSKGQLIDWVITQQRWNKDANFGMGNGC